MAELPPPVAPPRPPPQPPQDLPIAARKREAVGLAAQVLWAPIVLASVPLIVYVYASFIGIPLFVAAAAPFVAGRQRHRGGRAARPLVAVGFLAIAAVCAGWIIVLRQSAESLGDPAGVDWPDVLAVAALAGWALAAIGTSVVMLWRPRFVAARHDRTAVRR